MRTQTTGNELQRAVNFETVCAVRDELVAAISGLTHSLDPNNPIELRRVNDLLKAGLRAVKEGTAGAGPAADQPASLLSSSSVAVSQNTTKAGVDALVDAPEVSGAAVVESFRSAAAGPSAAIGLLRLLDRRDITWKREQLEELHAINAAALTGLRELTDGEAGLTGIAAGHLIADRETLDQQLTQRIIELSSEADRVSQRVRFSAQRRGGEKRA